MNDTTLTVSRRTALHSGGLALEGGTENTAKSRQFLPEMRQNDANCSKDMAKRHILGRPGTPGPDTKWHRMALNDAVGRNPRLSAQAIPRFSRKNSL